MTLEAYQKAKELIEEIEQVEQSRQRLGELMKYLDSASKPKTLLFEGYASNSCRVSANTAREILRCIDTQYEAEHTQLLKQMEEL